LAPSESDDNGVLIQCGRCFDHIEQRSLLGFLLSLKANPFAGKWRPLTRRHTLLALEVLLTGAFWDMSGRWIAAVCQSAWVGMLALVVVITALAGLLGTGILGNASGI
jgi:hypothetical protein